MGKKPEKKPAKLASWCDWWQGMAKGKDKDGKPIYWTRADFLRWLGFATEEDFQAYEVKRAALLAMTPEQAQAWRADLRAKERARLTERWGEGGDLLPRAVAFLVRNKGTSTVPMFRGRTAWGYVREFGPPELVAYLDGLGTDPDNWGETVRDVANAIITPTERREPGTFRAVNRSVICEKLMPYWGDLGRVEEIEDEVPPLPTEDEDSGDFGGPPPPEDDFDGYEPFGGGGPSHG